MPACLPGGASSPPSRLRLSAAAWFAARSPGPAVQLGTLPAWPGSSVGSHAAPLRFSSRLGAPSEAAPGRARLAARSPRLLLLLLVWWRWRLPQPLPEVRAAAPWGQREMGRGGLAPQGARGKRSSGEKSKTRRLAGRSHGASEDSSFLKAEVLFLRSPSDCPLRFQSVDSPRRRAPDGTLESLGVRRGETGCRWLQNL